MRAWQDLLFWLFQRGLKVSLGTARGMEAVTVLTLRYHILSTIYYMAYTIYHLLYLVLADLDNSEIVSPF